jgi:hypothetical protein
MTTTEEMLLNAKRKIVELEGRIDRLREQLAEQRPVGRRTTADLVAKALRLGRWGEGSRGLRFELLDWFRQSGLIAPKELD